MELTYPEYLEFCRVNPSALAEVELQEWMAAGYLGAVEFEESIANKLNSQPEPIAWIVARVPTFSDATTLMRDMTVPVWLLNEVCADATKSIENVHEIQGTKFPQWQLVDNPSGTTRFVLFWHKLSDSRIVTTQEVQALLRTLGEHRQKAGV